MPAVISAAHAAHAARPDLSHLVPARVTHHHPGGPKAIVVAAVVGVVFLSCDGQQPLTPMQRGDLAGASTTARSISGVTVNAAQSLATVSPTVLGANLANYYDITQGGIASSLSTFGFKALRWPGGSASDLFHWRRNWKCGGHYTAPNSTFDNFMTDVAEPSGASVAVTLNYGSDTTCSHGGSPSEAASWVRYANTTKHYGIKWWTVGNEEFGNWEYDLHPKRNDSVTYANAVATGFYPSIKAADPTSLVGVVVTPGEWRPGWDHYVLNHAKYDFVEMHWYPESPGQENDETLLHARPAQLTELINDLRSELAAAGHSVPIYIGEIGSVSSSPGKQAVSITQALFAGQVIGELLNDGIVRATWWIGYGTCSHPSGNDASSLYGWQSWGAYNLFADGPTYGCDGLARGTVLPTARAYQVAALVAHPGEHVLPASVAPTLGPNVRAYAVTQGSGYALLLFNLSETTAIDVPVSISALAGGSSITITTYDKAIYDESRSNTWAGPVTTTRGAWRGPVTIALPPWSMSAVILKP